MMGSAATLPPAALTCWSCRTNCSTVERTVSARGDPDELGAAAVAVVGSGYRDQRPHPLRELQ